MRRHCLRRCAFLSSAATRLRSPRSFAYSFFNVVLPSDNDFIIPTLLGPPVRNWEVIAATWASALLAEALADARMRSDSGAAARRPQPLAATGSGPEPTFSPGAQTLGPSMAPCVPKISKQLWWWMGARWGMTTKRCANCIKRNLSASGPDCFQLGQGRQTARC